MTACCCHSSRFFYSNGHIFVANDSFGARAAAQVAPTQYVVCRMNECLSDWTVSSFPPYWSRAGLIRFLHSILVGQQLSFG